MVLVMSCVFDIENNNTYKMDEYIWLMTRHYYVLLAYFLCLCMRSIVRKRGNWVRNFMVDYTVNIQ